jgi:lipopolysaccharide transport system permease protein
MSLIEITSQHQYFPDLREAWRHRRLAVVLARRNIKVRYMQTLLGSVWIVIQPLLLTGVLTVVFGLLLSVPTDGIPYGIYTFTGTVVWSAFQRALTDTGISLAGSSNIILKVYFPRLLIPVSSILTTFIDTLPVYFVLLAVNTAFGQFTGWLILLSPLFLLMALTMAFAIGIWVTVLDAVFRDIRLLVPSVLQLVFFITPVMYSQTSVPHRWLLVYRLNPFLGLINGFRWSMLVQAAAPDILDIAWSLGFTFLMLVGGLMLFARLETFVVDRV